MSVLAELKRRKVFRVAAAYLVFGWLLTEVLTTVLPTVGAPSWVSRTVVLVFAFGFLPTLFLAWAYEITPDGIRRQAEVDADESLQSRGGHRLEYLAIGAVVLGILFLAVFGAQPGVREDAPVAQAVAHESIAVLPFVNMSGNPENEYFSDGLTETLLHMLAQVPDLKVAARTSSFAFKNQNMPIGDIAATLGVAHVLEGSVQRAGDTVRVTAQLIRARDQFHVWSGNFDRQLDDIFAIQDEIAREVRQALSASILGTTASSPDAELTTSDADAYDLYLQAISQRSSFSHWGLQGEEKLLKGALSIDADFGAAKVALAYNYLRQAQTDLMDRDLAANQALALADQVLEEQPGNVDARAIRVFAGNVVGAAKLTAADVRATAAELAELVADQPTQLDARLLLVRLLTNIHELDEAESLLVAARRDDPLNAEILALLAGLHLQRGEWPEARALFARSLEIEARQPNVHASLAKLDSIEGNAAGSVRNLLRAIAVDPTDHELSGELALLLYELGLSAEADDLRKRVRSIAPTSNIAHQIEMLRLWQQGDLDALATLSERLISEDIGNRRNAYADAVRNYTRVALRTNTLPSALSNLAGIAPRLVQPGASNITLKETAARHAMLDAWHATLTPQELAARADQLVAAARSEADIAAADPRLHIDILLLRGDVEQAARVALDRIFTQSVLANLSWLRSLEQARFDALRQQPAIVAALERWQQELAAAREDARLALEGGSSAG